MRQRQELFRRLVGDMTSAARVVRIAVDVGGTFTDVVCEDVDGSFAIFKSPTTPEDPVQGMLDALAVAGAENGITVGDLLGGVELFVHGTTRATNAIISGETAKTALLLTEGHPDVLLWREGTRVNTFDHSQQNPKPYVPRRLTFEIPERIDAQGSIAKPLDEPAVVELLAQLHEIEIEAIAVCLLWSVLNGSHERRVGELIERYLPEVPYTLSHVLSPTVREYRRASATCIDASLKPLMSHYLAGVSRRLNEAGFHGKLLMMTSSGGVRDLSDVARSPIHSTASGPAAAPVAGRYYAARDGRSENAVVTDAGGTSYDVSLVRRGVIPWTRETRLGVSPYGHITGFPSVDIKSIGAGGGSIASVDTAGVLQVGPRSAGAVPGPVCYGRGGAEPTVTDASLLVGYLDPEYFLGGRMKLVSDAAADALERTVAEPLGMSLEDAASAVLELQIEHMVSAIEAITLNQGIDPRSAVLIGGGGSAGFYSVAIARRLGCSTVVMPETAAGLSAVGALFSDLTADYLATYPTTSAEFDYEGVNRVLLQLRADCERFAESSSSVTTGHELRFAVEARYRDQVWELEVPLRTESFEGPDDVAALRSDFDRVHEERLAHVDPNSDVELVTWRAHARCFLRSGETTGTVLSDGGRPPTRRRVYFGGEGWCEASVLDMAGIAPGVVVEGPAIVQSAVTTVVIDPKARATRTASGALVIDTAAAADRSAAFDDFSTLVGPS